MDQTERNKLKHSLLNEHWTEDLHHGLKEIDKEDAKLIVESLDDNEINYKVNLRKFQEDYIADYIQYLWEISPASFWKHVKMTFNNEIGLLWSDNMFYFERLCQENISHDILHMVVEYIGKCSEEEKQDLELLGDIIKSQAEDHDRLEEIKQITASLPADISHTTSARIDAMLQQRYQYR